MNQPITASRLSIPPASKLIVLGLGGFATAIGGGVAALTMNWFGGIATQGDIDRIVAPFEARASAAETTAQTALKTAQQVAEWVGQPTDVEKRIDGTLVERLRDVEVDRKRQVERVHMVVRENVGLQVAMHVGMDPRRKDAAERAKVQARAKYDQLVQSGVNPLEAAARVLEYARIPR